MISLSHPLAWRRARLGGVGSQLKLQHRTPISRSATARFGVGCVPRRALVRTSHVEGLQICPYSHFALLEICTLIAERINRAREAYQLCSYSVSTVPVKRINRAREAYQLCS